MLPLPLLKSSLKLQQYVFEILFGDFFAFFLSLCFSRQPTPWLLRYWTSDALFSSVHVTKSLDKLLQVPQSISTLNVSTAEAANYPAISLSR